MQKPPRRNLAPAAEAWGRWIDNKIQAIENKLTLGLTNLGAALAANTSSLKSLSYLADTGWSDVPWATAFGTIIRLRWRKVGGMITIDGQVNGTYTVGANTVATGITPTSWLPDNNVWGVCYIAGYAATAFLSSGGTLTVYQQTGASRTNAQFTITYPAPRP